MQSQWYRENDLYESLRNDVKKLKDYHLVQFFNEHPQAIIKKVELIWPTKDLSILIKERENFNDCYETLYKKRYGDRPSGSYFELLSKEDLDRLFALFDDINKVSVTISKNFIKEIENIFYHIQKIQKRVFDLTAEHIIPFAIREKKAEYKLNLFFVSEEDDDTILRNNNESKCVKNNLRLFAEGKNPNCVVKSEMGDMTVLMAAVKTRRPLLFRAALAYGALPNLIGDFSRFESPVEMLHWIKVLGVEKSFLKSIYEVLDERYSVLPKSIKNAMEEKEEKKINIEMALIKGKISTKLNFLDSKEIHTSFEPANLPEEELYLSKPLMKLYLLWKEFFDMPSPYKTFKSLFRKNAFLERIYERDTLIGFNFFEICRTKNSEHYIFHIMYSGMNEEYRGYRLSSLLIYRPAYSLQQLLPFKRIGVYFSAITYASWQTAIAFDPYPKKYHEVTHKVMERTILPGIFHAEEKLYVDESVGCYIKDDTSVKQSKKLNTTRITPDEWLFDRFRKLKPHSTKKRAVPTHFFLNASNQQKMRSIILSSLKINLDNHAKMFSILFLEFIKPLIEEAEVEFSQRFSSKL